MRIIGTVWLCLAGGAIHGQTDRNPSFQSPAAGRVAGQPAAALNSPAVHYTQSTYHDQDKKFIKEVYQVKDTVRNVPHGHYVSYFLNGKPESRGQFTNNETSGVWEFYFETGKLKMRGILFKGANYGLWEYFFESGKKSMEGIINGRSREGEWKMYYENGQLREVGSYDNNSRNGTWRTYFEDGALKGVIDYADDHGRFIEYYHSGKVRAEGPKAGARNVGYWRYFAEDGTLESDGAFEEGKKQGVWSAYFPSGRLASKGAVHNDEPTGQWEYWHQNGKLVGSGTFDNGQKNGRWLSYSPDGKLKSEIMYTAGRGTLVEYYESGKVRMKGELKDELREGSWEFFLEDGLLEGTCDYKAGKGIYLGYYPNGALQIKGAMEGDLKTGTWEIYEPDGKLSGYYKPFYDDQKLGAEIAGMVQKGQPASAKAKAQPHGQATVRKVQRSGSVNYFTPRYNEVHGVLFASNPIWLTAGQLPLAVEFYLQERLGHEFEFVGIRNPFFTADSEVTPGKEFQRGYSIAIKQKFYHALTVGSWYFGHEIRFTNVGHFVNDVVPGPVLGSNLFTFNATEQRIEWGALLGYRILKRPVAGGLTVDAFVSADIGYRDVDADEAQVARFTRLDQHPLSTTFHFGVNIGHMFSLR